VRLRELRLAQKLSQEKLAERAELLQPGGVSVETVRKLESTKRPRPLPRRRPAGGAYALEYIAEALNVDIGELLLGCFSRRELLDSSFAWVVEKQRERERTYASIIRSESLAEFVDLLPTDADSLLALPGLLQLTNAEAFAYIFALEREFAGLEMLIADEPPIVFLDDEDIDRWAQGMKLLGQDHDVFIELVTDYQRHFRMLAEAGQKRYQIVLNKYPFVQFLKSKSRDAGAVLMEDIVRVLDGWPRFELVLLDAENPPDEFEVMSRYQSIPTTLEDTLSVVIRQTSISAARVEYSLIPMPPSLSGLHRDIARIGEAWSIALDQYRSHVGTGSSAYYRDPSRLTSELLIDIARELWGVEL
jgi:transcriptional regulator with XRE-family HTH domain